MSEKEHINVVVIGNAGFGKSTVIGRLALNSNPAYEDLIPQLQATLQETHDYCQAASGIVNAKNGYGQITPWEVVTPKYEVSLYEIPDQESMYNLVSNSEAAFDSAILILSASSGEGYCDQTSADETMQFAQCAKQLGINEIAVAVNKIDTTRWSEDRFNELVKESTNGLRHQARYNPREISFVPISAAHGDNFFQESPNIPWFKGWTKQYRTDYGTDSIVKGKTLLDAIDSFTPIRRR